MLCWSIYIISLMVPRKGLMQVQKVRGCGGMALAVTSRSRVEAVSGSRRLEVIVELGS